MAADQPLIGDAQNDETVIRRIFGLSGADAWHDVTGSAMRAARKAQPTPSSNRLPFLWGPQRTWAGSSSTCSAGNLRVVRRAAPH